MTLMDSADPSHRTASRAAAALIACTAAFQVALVAGAPWGAAAWGGQHPGVLPARLRRASAVSALTLGSLAVVVGTPGLTDPATRQRVLPAAAGAFSLGTVMNAASRSQQERTLWTPVAATTAALLWQATREARAASAPVAATRGQGR